MAQNYGPWYENEGPTLTEMRQEIKDKFLKKENIYYFIWRKKKPYLYLKAINEIVECESWPLVSWRGWYSVKDSKDTYIIDKAELKYDKLLKELTKKKLSSLLIPYINQRLYRFPDGLRIKHIRESFYQGANK